MNPKEASAKLCPFVQNVVAVVTATNPANPTLWKEELDKDVPANITCKANNCMAWHWHCKFENDALEFSTTDGYCRLIHEGEV